MRRKAIAGTIKRKMQEWWESIEDVELRALVERDTIVSGGAIASMLLNEAVRDFDVYLATHDTTLALARYYVDKFALNPPPRFKNDTKDVTIVVEDRDGRISLMIKSAGVASEQGDEGYEYFENEEAPGEGSSEYIARVTKAAGGSSEKKKKYRPVFLTQNAITLSDSVQIVTRFYGSPEEIHKNYDFVHCTNYWTLAEGIVLTADAMEALLAKELRYMGSRYPICSIFRTRKFLERGFYITAGQYLKMCWQVNDLDLNDMKVLEDQLTGVDTAYFTQLINVVKAEKEKNPNLNIDNTYIAQLVDKLF